MFPCISGSTVGESMDCHEKPIHILFPVSYTRYSPTVGTLASISWIEFQESNTRSSFSTKYFHPSCNIIYYNNHDVIIKFPRTSVIKLMTKFCLEWPSGIWRSFKAKKWLHTTGNSNLNRPSKTPCLVRAILVTLVKARRFLLAGKPRSPRSWSS